ncbi:hypothetical protein M9H77_29171 [Catharanthus roseus]|uniref:Uncharacterized protein n=1 Tax=Catharanthus roseus TaxID=4058 RepID=A0ACC0AK60_CATRO|nr:hypothetical protein M9H77_29171 [Catharanthus roseus]
MASFQPPLLILHHLTIFLIFFFFLLLLTITKNADAVLSHHPPEKNKATELFSLKKFPWMQQQQQGSKESTLCVPQKSRAENGAIILEMRHRENYSGIKGEYKQRQQKQLQADKIRVQSIQKRIKKLISSQVVKADAVSPQTRIPITSGVKLQTLNYIITATFGDRNLTVIVDTGSDLTWIQCQPCKSCYNQPEPLFNPSLSPSYESIPCNSSTCKTLEFATGNMGSCGRTNTAACNYMVSYGDGSYTRGQLGKERLILGTTPIDNFVFGCGRNNKGLFGSAAGLMGLGRSDLSLISQTYDQFGGIFSYCLPSTDTEAASGSLILGDDSSVYYKNSTPFSYTRMVQNHQLLTFYFLNLTGISIGGVSVSVSSPSFGKGGILIDSGTVITRLPPTMYRQVKAEFLKQFSGYEQAPSFSILDTCFNLSTYEEVNIPTIKMKFEGDAELIVDVTGTFYFAKPDASQVCLALASLSYEDEIGIIGNYQQRNTRVIYNTKESKLGFARETCSFN